MEKIALIFSQQNFGRFTNHKFWENIELNWKNTKRSCIFGIFPILRFCLKGISNFDNVPVVQTYSDLYQVSQGCVEKSCFNQKFRLSRIVIFFGHHVQWMEQRFWTGPQKDMNDWGVLLRCYLILILKEYRLGCNPDLGASGKTQTGGAWCSLSSRWRKAKVSIRSQQNERELHELLDDTIWLAL